MQLDKFQLVGYYWGVVLQRKVRFVIVTSASLGYSEAASEERN